MDIAGFLASIAGIIEAVADLLFSLLTAAVLFTAYETNRQLNIISRRQGKTGYYSIFNKLRYLFLFLGMQYAIEILEEIPNYDGPALAIVETIIFFAIGLTIISIALNSLFLDDKKTDKKQDQ